MLTKSNWNEAKEILDNNSTMSSWGMCGGIQSFTYLSFKGLKELVDKKLISLGERQNYSPTVKQWIELVGKNNLQDILFFHGYIVEADRSDRRVTIEGAQAEGGKEIFTEDQWKSLMKISRGADEFSKDPFRVWWD